MQRGMCSSTGGEQVWFVDSLDRSARQGCGCRVWEGRREGRGRSEVAAGAGALLERGRFGVPFSATSSICASA